MSKPAAERPLWVHQDRLNLPFPAVQGTALLLKARFLLSGMGRCVKFFSLREGFFFALLLIFPLWEAKEPARPSQEAGCHKICFHIDPTGLFFTCRTKKITEAPEPRRHPSSATGMPSAQKNFQTALPGLPDRPARQVPSPARTDTSSPLPCPLQCEQKNFPKQKQSVREPTTWGCFAPATGQSLRTPDVVAAIRRSATTRDAQSCSAARMREGDFPHGKPPSSAS